MNYKNLSKYAQEKYKHFKVDYIEQTKCNRKIFKWSCIFDSTRPFVLLQGAMHAREYITTDILMMFIRQIEEDFENLKDIGTPNLIIIPMVNPDGVELVKYGLASVPERYHAKLLEMNGGNLNFSMFKSNIRGVDINNNFDAKWERQKGASEPSASGFKGHYCASEIESKAIIKETKLCSAVFTISFHAKGEEIYYSFYQKGKRRYRDKRIAKHISNLCGYKVRNVERFSSGGYKDWCIEKLKIPALTIEVGSDDLSHPIHERNAKNIFYKLRDVCYTLCDVIKIIGEYDESRIHACSSRTCKKSKI